MMSYARDSPSRTEVDALPGAVALQFGTNWCGFCTRAEPLISQALAGRPEVRRVLVEDGRGRPLGRSFGIKLWPTIVVLQDGVEVARVVRPRDAGEVEEAIAKLG
jgi:thioredoxin 1